MNQSLRSILIPLVAKKANPFLRFRTLLIRMACSILIKNLELSSSRWVKEKSSQSNQDYHNRKKSFHSNMKLWCRNLIIDRQIKNQKVKTIFKRYKLNQLLIKMLPNLNHLSKVITNKKMVEVFLAITSDRQIVITDLIVFHMEEIIK